MTDARRKHLLHVTLHSGFDPDFQEIVINTLMRKAQDDVVEEFVRFSKEGFKNHTLIEEQPTPEETLTLASAVRSMVPLSLDIHLKDFKNLHADAILKS